MVSATSRLLYLWKNFHSVVNNICVSEIADFFNILHEGRGIPTTRLAQVACKYYIQVIYMHVRLAVNGDLNRRLVTN